MTKYKVGDKVMVINETDGWKKGDTFVIERIRKGFQSNVAFIESNFWGVRFDDLELAPFTQQDLEEGMYVEFENTNIGLVDGFISCISLKKAKGVVAIYRPNVKGDLIKVWERKEKRYTLSLPNVSHVQNKYIFRPVFGDYFFDSYEVNEGNLMYFTLEEIMVLPNQPLVQTLVKEEV